MLNFSIMTLDEEHIDEVCEDIAYQVQNGIATMPQLTETHPRTNLLYCRS